MPPKSSSNNTHHSAFPHRAVQLLLVTLGQLKAIGMERDVCVGTRACALLPSGDKPQGIFQVSLCLILSSPSPFMCMIFVPASSPPAHNLSAMTHTLSGFDLDSICFLSQSDPSSSVAHRRSVGLEQNVYLYLGERRGWYIDSSLRVSPCLICLHASIWLSCKKKC